MANEETNKELVKRYFDERWNTRNYSVVDELDGGGEIEEHKAWIEQVKGLFSESHLRLGDMIAEGDRVALHWTTTGVLRDGYEGVGSSGERVTYSGIAMLRIADGKIVDDVAYSEGFGTVILGQTYQQQKS